MCSLHTKCKHTPLLTDKDLLFQSRLGVMVMWYQHKAAVYFIGFEQLLAMQMPSSCDLACKYSYFWQTIWSLTRNGIRTFSYQREHPAFTLAIMFCVVSFICWKLSIASGWLYVERDFRIGIGFDITGLFSTNCRSVVQSVGHGIKGHER